MPRSTKPSRSAGSAGPAGIRAATPAPFGPAGGPLGIGLDALVGHASLRRLLKERSAAGLLPHALLFVGPRGVGKRTLAQALVAERFCKERRGCGTCADCGALLRGNHPGLLTLACTEGKNTISIDAVKELERELSLRPQDERGRIALIDGADHLTPAAQDALLKTLEEPPPGNVLVLTAARIDALFATIRSRCQRFVLTPLTDAEVGEVAGRLGLAPVLPLAVAMGCPGEVERLADPVVERTRRGVLKLLCEERGREDQARLVALLHDGLDADAEPSDVRARAHLILSLVGSFVRDIIVLRASGAGDRVRNSDCWERLGALTGRSEWSDALGLLQRLARAHDRINGNVDPASLLFCVFHPATEEAALANEF